MKANDNSPATAEQLRGAVIEALNFTAGLFSTAPDVQVVLAAGVTAVAAKALGDGKIESLCRDVEAWSRRHYDVTPGGVTPTAERNAPTNAQPAGPAPNAAVRAAVNTLLRGMLRVSELCSCATIESVDDGEKLIDDIMAEITKALATALGTGGAP